MNQTELSWLSLAHKIIEKSHHYVWALAVVAVAFLWFHQPKVVTQQLQQRVPAIAKAGSVVRESHAAISAVKQVSAAYGHATSYEQTAVNVVPKAIRARFSSAAVANGLSALGHTKTAMAVAVAHVAPTPVAVASTPPGISSEYARWLDATIYNADARAIANTTTKVDITQQEVEVSRTSAIYLSDRSTGAAYAIKRRGQMDIEIGLVQNGGPVAPVAGVAYRLKHTEFGAFVGVTVHGARASPVAGFGVYF